MGTAVCVANLMVFDAAMAASTAAVDAAIFETAAAVGTSAADIENAYANNPNFTSRTQERARQRNANSEGYEWLSRNMDVPLSYFDPVQVAQTTTTLPLRSSTAAPRPNAPLETEISVPLSERGRYLGDVPIIVRVDIPYFEAARIAELLKDVISPTAAERLKALGQRGRISVGDLRALGISTVWDPGLLTLDVIVTAGDKTARDIELAENERTERGTFTRPANFAIFTNLRSSLDYNHLGAAQGLNDPYVDAYVGGRILGVAFENELSYDSSGFGFRRNASRIVLDNERTATRTIIGDVRPQVRGYQYGGDVLGVSIFSAYQSIQPLRNLRPRGEGSFSINDPSNVDVVVNGQVVRRLRLDSGTYNLKDFSFLDGQNRVSFVVEDRTGRRELAKFDVFFTRELLDPKLNEWALTVGSTTARGLRGPIYDNGKAYAAGFLRRGMSQSITMGGNLLIEGHSGIAGWEAVFGTKLGILSWDVARSFSQNGNGNALNLSFQRSSNNQSGEQGSTWGLAASARTINFGTTDDQITNNQDIGTASAFWSRNLNSRSNLSLDASYNFARDRNLDNWTLRMGYGRRMGNNIGLSADVSYNANRFNDNVTFRVQLSKQFGRNGNGSAAYESRDSRYSLNAQRSGQSGFGAWSVSGNVDSSRNASGLNAGAFLAANRGEVGLSHSTSFSSDFQTKTDERSSLRFATSLGFADGAFAWGKPVTGAFAIARPHSSLRGRKLVIDGASGSSRFFGPALVSNLPNYSRRDLAVDVENLPAGYDLGAGSISVRAPYNAGYRLVVGSADNLTVIGRALNELGLPISFVSAKAKRRSDGKEVELFTNANGVFAANGLGPGAWDILFNTEPDTTKISFDLNSIGDATRRLGDLRGIVE